MELREWTPRRVKAAEQAVQREADKVALFPELRRFASVKQRQSMMDERELRICKRLRDGRAAMWKEARSFLRQLSEEDRVRFLKKWNTRFTPGGPAELLSVARLMGSEIPNKLISES